MFKGQGQATLQPTVLFAQYLLTPSLDQYQTSGNIFKGEGQNKEMVWNELKRRVARDPRTKQELQESVMQFWRTEITPEKCTVYIDHIYKVVFVCVNEGKCDR